MHATDGSTIVAGGARPPPAPNKSHSPFAAALRSCENTDLSGFGRASRRRRLGEVVAYGQPHAEVARRNCLLQRRVAPGLGQRVRQLPARPQSGDSGKVPAVLELSELLGGRPILLSLHHPVGVERVMQQEVVGVGVDGVQVELVAVVDVSVDRRELYGCTDSLEHVVDLRGTRRVRDTALAVRDAEQRRKNRFGQHWAHGDILRRGEDRIASVDRVETRLDAGRVYK